MKILDARKDPLTGESFIPKRKNQKYASRANQIKFNNRRNSSSKKKNIKKDEGVKSSQKKVDFIPYEFKPKPLAQNEIADYFAMGFISCAVIAIVIMIFYKNKK